MNQIPLGIHTIVYFSPHSRVQLAHHLRHQVEELAPSRQIILIVHPSDMRVAVGEFSLYHVFVFRVRADYMEELDVPFFGNSDGLVDVEVFV